MVSIVSTEAEAKALVGTTVCVGWRGRVPVLGYRPTANGSFVLTGMPQEALDDVVSSES
jgi:hypothetical protein